MRLFCDHLLLLFQHGPEAPGAQTLTAHSPEQAAGRGPAGTSYRPRAAPDTMNVSFPSSQKPFTCCSSLEQTWELGSKDFIVESDGWEWVHL